MHAHRLELVAPGVGDGGLAAVGQHDRRAVGGVQRVEQRSRRELRRLRITLAVAGFTRDQLDVTAEESQLVIRGRQQEDKARQYLHRGIAARQFQRTFVLADGMDVLGADLKNGLLSIDLARPEPERIVKTISITDHDD